MQFIHRTDTSYVMLRVAELVDEACRRGDLDRFAFLQVDKEWALLMDHVGACERILKTPLARAYAIKIRRLIVPFLGTLPFALLHGFENGLLVPLVTMLVAYPVLGLDQIGVELQNPFSTRSLSHLPLGDISQAIELDLLAMLPAEGDASPAGGDGPPTAIARSRPMLSPGTGGTYRQPA